MNVTTDEAAVVHAEVVVVDSVDEIAAEEAEAVADSAVAPETETTVSATVASRIVSPANVSASRDGI